MDRSVGARLRRQREWRRLEQRDVARLARVAAASISVVENGRQEPTVRFLQKVVPVLWEEGADEALREFLVMLGYPVPGLNLRALDGSDADPMEQVTSALYRGPWPEKIVQAVTVILEPWVVDSSGRRVAGEGA